MALLDKVNEIFREVFANPGLKIDEATNATHIEDWDSYAQINLIVAIEERFNVQFTTRELSSLTCVGDVLKKLREKGVNGD